MTQPTQAQIEAVRRVVERCRKANPSHMHIPVSGATAMEWLLEELTAAIEPDHAAEASAYLRDKARKHEIAATIECCAQVADGWKEWDDRPPSPEAIAARIRALKDKP